MAQTGVNLYDFRTEFNIPAADLRSICKQLKLRIVKQGEEHYIMEGDIPYKCGIEYLLKHAVYEYRATMHIDNTLQGIFTEFELETSKGIVSFGLKDMNKDSVKPQTPSLKKKPNKKTIVPETVLDPQPVFEEDQSAAKSPKPPAKTKGTPLDAKTTPRPLETLTDGCDYSQVLGPQKELLFAAEHGFLISTKQLSMLIGLSAETIRFKKSGFKKLGFEFSKVQEGMFVLWKASQY